MPEEGEAARFVLNARGGQVTCTAECEIRLAFVKNSPKKSKEVRPHANDPLSPSPPLGPGSTSQLPKSQSPTGEHDQLNLRPSSPHGNTDLNRSPYQGLGLTDNLKGIHPLASVCNCHSGHYARRGSIVRE